MAPILKKATATFCIRISSGHSMKSFLCKQMHLAFENDILYGQDATIVALCIFHGHWTIWTLFKDGWCIVFRCNQTKGGLQKQKIYIEKAICAKVMRKL